MLRVWRVWNGRAECSAIPNQAMAAAKTLLVQPSSAASEQLKGSVEKWDNHF